jgi:putative restriction endonuclease
MKFKFGNLVETTAAHIIPKQRSGTDDPRNGLSLCRTHHWAFDEGIFSLSDDYEVIPSSALKKAEMRNFNLIDLKDRQIVLPENKNVYPHKQSLLWHRDEVLLK